MPANTIVKDIMCNPANVSLGSQTDDYRQSRQGKLKCLECMYCDNASMMRFDGMERPQLIYGFCTDPMCEEKQWISFPERLFH
jgi:hypothetical protein